ncbi:MAG: hypothetical protein JW786_04160 [Desulfobacterales bacterium]|nr:hypothetical protein [Desulfobacterales bacterium]
MTQIVNIGKWQDRLEKHLNMGEPEKAMCYLLTNIQRYDEDQTLTAFSCKFKGDYRC